jgi:hypothetical protein
VLFLERGVVVGPGGVQAVPEDRASNERNGRSSARPVTHSHPVAELLSAEVKNETAQRPTKRRVHVEHDLLIELRVETCAPAVEVRCGMDFTANKGNIRVRLELPEPVRFDRPGTYVLSGRADPRTLEPATVYQLQADVVVLHPAEDEPVILAREAGRISTVGSDVRADLQQERDTVPHWNGGTAVRAQSEWSVR